MDMKEKLVQLLDELYRGIDAGDFKDAEKIPEKYTYGHLWALFFFVDLLDGGVQLYEQLYDLAMECGKAAIRKKVQRGEKIKVAFLAVSAAEWPAESVYRLFEQDERVECYIVVSPLIDRDLQSRQDTYRQTYEYFKHNGYNVIGGYDEVLDMNFLWSELGGVPDIVLHLSPWCEAMPAEYSVTSFPLRCVNCYIPYGIYVANSEDGSHIKRSVFNKEFVNMMWKIYADSELNLVGYQKYGLLRGKNVVYSGYAKMDYFYSEKRYSQTEIRKIWKFPTDIQNAKKIVIAPHHAIRGYGGIKYSTFPKNAFFLLYLAKKYKDQISFILKPHPNLRFRAVEAGVFESYEAYDAYLEEWNLLPNARVVQEADYLDIFATSDGMIMDSASFLAEYLYVNKPLLFLRRPGQAFNSLGASLIEAHYQVNGEDYAGIEGFLENVIVHEKDDMRQKREEIFVRELDYVNKNVCKASEYIYRDILTLFRDGE